MTLTGSQGGQEAMVAKIFYNKISERANIQKKTKKRKSYSL